MVPSVGKAREWLRSLRCGQSSKTTEPLWEAAGQFLIKVHTHLPGDSTVSLLRIYSREMRTYVTTYTRMLITVLSIIAPNRKQPKCPAMGEGSANTIYSHKGMSLWKASTCCRYTQQHGWLLKTCWEGGAGHKSVCTLWPGPAGTWQSRGCLVGGRVTGGARGTLLGWGSNSTPWPHGVCTGGGYTGAYNCQNSQNYVLAYWL